MQGVANRPVRVLTPEQILYSREFVHRLESGGASGSTKLLCGEVVSYRDVTGVLNRFRQVPTAHLKAAVPSDHSYIVQELHAILASWIHGFPCPVINRPTPASLTGHAHPDSVWLNLAARCGLPVVATEFSVDGNPPPLTIDCRGIVLHGQLFGCAAIARHAADLRQLSDIAGLDLMEVEFTRTQGEPAFARVRPLADLSAGGAPLAAAIVETLTGASP